ncbi:MAG: hypothetical protein C5B53_06130 [Candidatus Melainabacteria bacterium]|nr:MAG: hypothetical protein C5B53_06130 [Candidatus Melainabacteria bacterium]
MNPLRALFLSFSRMPPSVMLLIIIGLAVVVTMMVTGKVSESEKAYESSSGAGSIEDVDPKNARTALYSRTYIPANTKIEDKEIEERKIDKLEIWDDATSTSSDVIGHTTKHAIPENAQIRQIDLE